jgi:hypothetical protein
MINKRIRKVTKIIKIQLRLFYFKMYSSEYFIFKKLDSNFKCGSLDLGKTKLANNFFLVFSVSEF